MAPQAALERLRNIDTHATRLVEQLGSTIVRGEREKRWLEQNRAAIAAYNQRVATHGLLADDAALL